mmetsp:Transcript_5752/g.15360  ORF Transcript_5752/g.15360 Transcript_5752/m.15360 type:complete len:281 (-) Transcript_5752:359-1201(-)
MRRMHACFLKKKRGLLLVLVQAAGELRNARKVVVPQPFFGEVKAVHRDGVELLLLSALKLGEHVVREIGGCARGANAHTQPRIVLLTRKVLLNALQPVVTAGTACRTHAHAPKVEVSVVNHNKQRRARRNLVVLEERAHGLAAQIHVRHRLHERHLTTRRTGRCSGRCERLEARAQLEFRGAQPLRERVHDVKPNVMPRQIILSAWISKPHNQEFVSTRHRRRRFRTFGGLSRGLALDSAGVEARAASRRARDGERPTSRSAACARGPLTRGVPKHAVRS